MRNFGSRNSERYCEFFTKGKVRVSMITNGVMKKLLVGFIYSIIVDLSNDL